MRLRLFLVGRPISSYFYNGRRRAMPRLSSEWWRSSTARRATVAIACCLKQAKVAIRLAVQALCTIAAHNPARLPAETRSARFYDKSGSSTRHTHTSPVRSTARSLHLYSRTRTSTGCTPFSRRCRNQIKQFDTAVEEKKIRRAKPSR